MAPLPPDLQNQWYEPPLWAHQARAAIVRAIKAAGGESSECLAQGCRFIGRIWPQKGNEGSSAHEGTNWSKNSFMPIQPHDPQQPVVIWPFMNRQPPKPSLPAVSVGLYGAVSDAEDAELLEALAGALEAKKDDETREHWREVCIALIKGEAEAPGDKPLCDKETDRATFPFKLEEIKKKRSARNEFLVKLRKDFFPPKREKADQADGAAKGADSGTESATTAPPGKTEVEVQTDDLPEKAKKDKKDKRKSRREKPEESDAEAVNASASATGPAEEKAKASGTITASKTPPGKPQAAPGKALPGKTAAAKSAAPPGKALPGKPAASAKSVAKTLPGKASAPALAKGKPAPAPGKPGPAPAETPPKAPGKSLPTKPVAPVPVKSVPKG
eukprot:gnl/MRDRNA2_/MRDRNA2_150044_c0_seq1.p1 gnl/MRDRNA2_/MRDRNA2_150044_c0~~gnl/MRDRNA2_/MRDRNA2_150044_c0_seq1.p1  ORF type:complete len:449 (+),score=130.87 gnl/MRDRNA2_/MRDRNA2_150044_c0_seq1:187-1347(+)